jgi:hypothetical protein
MPRQLFRWKHFLLSISPAATALFMRKEMRNQSQLLTKQFLTSMDTYAFALHRMLLKLYNQSLGDGRKIQPALEG